MHFVICTLTSVVILAVCVLFTEVFPKVVKALFALIASYTTGYAAMILVRHIQSKLGWKHLYKLFPNVWYASGVTLVVIILCVLVIASKNKKKAAA